VLREIVYGLYSAIIPPPRKRAPVGSAQHYHEEVAWLCDKLSFKLAPLRHRHPVSAIAAAMAIHLVSALSKCLADGCLTRDQIRELILRVVALEHTFQDIKFSKSDHERP
jgi:hypothetical protein